MRPMKTGKKIHHLGPQRRMPTSWDTLLPVTSHLCSWAGCHSMSHLTGRTSVESPPAPEGAGRRRRQKTCRRNLGPLSCHGLGRQDLRRTQLGRPGRRAGPSCFLELSLLAPLNPHPAFGPCIAFLLVPLELWLWGSPGSMITPASALLCVSSPFHIQMLINNHIHVIE